MKILILLLIFSSLAMASVKPERGLYVCKKGNADSICDQMLKTYFQGESLSAITVEYVGECGSMGPYTYYCDGETCEDPGLRFEFKDSRHYSWENKQYGFKCEFEKK